MVYRVGSKDAGIYREVYLRPGVVVCVFGGGSWPYRRCRVRRLLKQLRILAPFELRGDSRPRARIDDGDLEVLVEWLDDEGELSGELGYLPVRRLHPDLGPNTCSVPQSSSE